jgi:hypothetical protein
MTQTQQNPLSASTACRIDDINSDSDSYGWDADLAAAMVGQSGQIGALS